jgi:sugar (pentulose or hexulose) kinase
MLADVLKRELQTIETTAASARGAALLAGIATGVWTDARETAAIAPRVSLVTTPDAERVGIYEERYGRFLENSNGK